MSRFDQPDAPDDDPFGDDRYLAICSNCRFEFAAKYEEDEVCAACELKADRANAEHIATRDEDVEHPF